MVSEREKHLIPYAHTVVTRLFGKPDLVLEESHIGYSALKPDLIFLFRREPYLVLVELEVDADNKYCFWQSFCYTYYGLTLVVCDHVSSHSLAKYAEWGIGVAIRNKLLLVPRLVRTNIAMSRKIRDTILKLLSKRYNKKFILDQASILDYM